MNERNLFFVADIAKGFIKEKSKQLLKKAKFPPDYVVGKKHNKTMNLTHNIQVQKIV